MFSDRRREQTYRFFGFFRNSFKGNGGLREDGDPNLNRGALGVGIEIGNESKIDRRTVIYSLEATAGVEVTNRLASFIKSGNGSF